MNLMPKTPKLKIIDTEDYKENTGNKKNQLQMEHQISKQ
jgi:hypothetical protein